MKKVSVNETLRELRIKCGYTQSQIAHILGIDRSTYSYYEIGKTTPDIGTLIKLSKIFNVPIEEMLSEEHRPVPANDAKAPFGFSHGKKNASHIYELSALERDLVRAFRSCTEEIRMEIFSCIRDKSQGGTAFERDIKNRRT